MKEVASSLEAPRVTRLPARNHPPEDFRLFRQPNDAQLAVAAVAAVSWQHPGAGGHRSIVEKLITARAALGLPTRAVVLYSTHLAKGPS